MLKKLLHKIMSVFMAIVVLCSTISFTIDMHYCGDTLVEASLFHKAKGCGMEMQNPSSSTCSKVKKNCCRDKKIVVEGQSELQLKVDKISFEQQVFVASFVYAYINLFERHDAKITSYEDYSPPLVVKPIYKLDETYLI